MIQYLEFACGMGLTVLSMVLLFLLFNELIVTLLLIRWRWRYVVTNTVYLVLFCVVASGAAYLFGRAI